VSDLRFLEELGAEFERIGAIHESAPRSQPSRKRWIRVPRSAVAGAGLVVSVLVVVAVLAVGFGLHPRSRAGSPVPGGVRVVFSATAVNPRSPLGPSLERSVDILRQRLSSVFPSVHVSRAGNGLVVVVPKARSGDRARIVALAAPARLEFYDWEANALTPNGQTVASQLQTQDPTALQISQGSGFGPGAPGAASMNLYNAVALASKQAPAPSSNNARLGPAYYMFGAPGSEACKLAADDQGTVPTVGAHCYLSGPSAHKQDLISGLPNRVHASEAETLVVPRGITVLQAVPKKFADPPAMSSAAAEFFVLKDRVALPGSDITDPQPSTDSAGNPNVKFGIRAKAKNEFQSVTSAIAHRGDVVSREGQTLDQHFAIALDNRLITVPSIDPKTYPHGINTDSGADITARFTVQSAQDVATMLRFGPLPVRLAIR
jgi:SecD/SecF fusion protein